MLTYIWAIPWKVIKTLKNVEKSIFQDGAGKYKYVLMSIFVDFHRTNMMQVWKPDLQGVPVGAKSIFKFWEFFLGSKWPWMTLKKIDEIGN